MKYQCFLAIAATAAFTISIVSCGGGGGGSGSDFEAAATVSLDVVPQNIDSGDRMTLRALVGEVNSNGILLKFRYPTELNYVTASAFLKIHGQNIDLSPAVNESEAAPTGTAAASPTVAGTPSSTETSTNSNTYLVFFLSQSLFTHPDDDEYKGDFGEVTLQLEGRGAVTDDLVEVDADIDDPTTSNDGEFDISNPEFSPQDEKSISVTN